jgi:hypothetical protein
MVPWCGHTNTPRELTATKGQEQQALGRSLGGFSTRIHLRAKGGGRPITFHLTAGQWHEQTAFALLMRQRRSSGRDANGRDCARTGESVTKAIAVARRDGTCSDVAFRR